MPLGALIWNLCEHKQPAMQYFWWIALSGGRHACLETAQTADGWLRLWGQSQVKPFLHVFDKKFYALFVKGACSCRCLHTTLTYWCQSNEYVSKYTAFQYSIVLTSHEDITATILCPCLRQACDPRWLNNSWSMSLNWRWSRSGLWKRKEVVAVTDICCRLQQHSGLVCKCSCLVTPCFLKHSNHVVSLSQTSLWSTLIQQPMVDAVEIGKLVDHELVCGKEKRLLLWLTSAVGSSSIQSVSAGHYV